MSDIKKPDISSLRIDPSAKHSGQPKKTWLWISLILISIFGATAFAWFSDKAVSVEVATARSFNTGTDSAILSASGYVTPRRKATVASKITARIIEMNVEEGMAIEENQILARLDDKEAKAHYKSAVADHEALSAAIPGLEISLQDTRRDLARAKALYQEKIIDQNTLDKAQVKLETTQSQLEVAKKQAEASKSRIEVAKQEIEDCIIRSPFSGVAVSKDAQIGEIVSPMSAGGGFTRTGISTIVDMTSLEIEVDVNESYISRVSIGQKVKAALDAYPEWQIPASVRAVIPTADRQKATVKVRISFDELDPKILPDMGIKVFFLSESSKEKNSQVQALIPKDALRETNGKKSVFVVKDGKLQNRFVTIGHITESNVEILNGIFPGEQLVISGPSQLKEGQKVKVGLSLRD